MREGENTLIQLGIHGVHPEIVKHIGRMKYRSSYGQNLLQHSIEVAYLTGIMAAELGFDSNLAKRAGLMHDIGKTIDKSIEGPHALIGYELAKKYKDKLSKEKVFPNPIVTEITPFTNFYKAENYHQNYYNENKRQPYCSFVITPKLEKFKKIFHKKLKKE